MRLFGDQGIRSTTIRQIAEASGVSPALVIHHFGSKDALRRACDDWLLERISRDKTAAVTGHFESGSYGRSLEELRPFMAYIGASLSDGGETADLLFDHLCDLTSETYDAGIAAGTMTEPSDRAATVATLAAFTAGASLLGRHIARRLGGEELLDRHVYERYSLAALELFTTPMFTTETFLDDVVRAITEPDEAGDPDPPPGA